MAQRAAAKTKSGTTRKRSSGSKSRTPAKAKAKAPAKAGAQPVPRRREILGILLLTLGLGVLLAVSSFSPRDAVFLASGKLTPHNLIGPVGHRVAEALLTGIGVGALVVGVSLLGMAWAMFARRAVHLTVVEALGWAGFVLSGTVLAHLALPEVHPLHHAPGGVVGLVLGEILREHLATVGAVIVASALALLSLVVASDFTVARIVAGVFRALGRGLGGVAPFLRGQWSRHQESRQHRAELRAQRRAEEEARRAEARAEAEAEAVLVVEREDKVVDETPPAPPAPRRRRRAAVEAPPPPVPAAPLPVPAAPAHAIAIAPRDDVEALAALNPLDPLADPTHADPDWAGALAALKPPPSAPPAEDGPASAAADAPAAPPRRRRRPSREVAAEVVPQPAPGTAPGALLGAEAEEPEDAPSVPTAQWEAVAPPAPEVPAAPESPPAPEPEAPAPAAGGAPTIVRSKAPDRPAERRQETFAFTTHGDDFLLPGLDLLDTPPATAQDDLDQEQLHDTARKLTQKLADFGIAGEVTKIRLGPVVTMYEFVPGPGVKISKIAGLADDLAMAMEALRVRIVAPLPGKGAVGIEVPNRKRQTVALREVLEQDTFLRSKGKLTLAMGKDVEGMPFYVDLAQMPHLLIAGTTGSGKSVSVNAMITSILYRSTPDDVRFLMVDPKWTELSLYEGIPHLLLPVVKDPAKAALALRWAVEEMDRRYQLLADVGVRSLAGYNREAARLLTAWEEQQAKLEPLPPLEEADGDHARYMELKQAHEERILAFPKPPEKLPLIVIVIDELADLMMVAGREVETYIARIAQKARAAGIHLMVATQRPSTDVLTGLIKVNFPARIGFRVASRHDSQTIINGPGSEKLLGKGDMLMIPPGQSDPLRVHGAFVSDDEIKAVVGHLKAQGQPIYDESILKPRDEDGGEGGGDDDGPKDAKWDEAVYMVSERDSVSVSFLQRRLGIGYNRAARMIEQMEREGIVGPADGTKPREVLISPPPV